MATTDFHINEEMQRNALEKKKQIVLWLDVLAVKTKILDYLNLLVMQIVAGVKDYSEYTFNPCNQNIGQPRLSRLD